MSKCDCYHRIAVYGGVCYGTKECDPCNCDGDEAKCSFYPEKRRKAKELDGGKIQATKIGLRNMLETCADVCGVDDTLCREMCCPYDGDRNCHETILMDSLALIENLEAQQPKWISVEEREPEFPCICYDGVNAISIPKSIASLTLKNGKKVFVSDAFDAFLEAFPHVPPEKLDDCTHILYWMPLPEPPNNE